MDDVSQFVLLKPVALLLALALLCAGVTWGGLFKAVTKSMRRPGSGGVYPALAQAAAFTTISFILASAYVFMLI